MCKAPSPPPPQAPPAPIPRTDAVMEARNDRQQKAGLAAQTGYQATMLTERGDSSAANNLKPTLGA